MRRYARRPDPVDRALAAPDTPSVNSLGESYRIAPMDQLTIKVFNAKELSDDYDVDLAGHISLPLIGEVAAANLTTAQLDAVLTAKLGEKYFEHPDVSVGVKKSVGRLVTVDGAVKEAGSFPALGTFADAGRRARQGHERGRQSASRRGVPDDRRQASGRGIRPCLDPAWAGARSRRSMPGTSSSSTDLDQGAAEAVFQSIPLLAIFGRSDDRARETRRGAD